MYIVKELKYSVSNNYLIKGGRGSVLFDTGWAGSFALFRGALREAGEKLRDIRFLLISHFHPDHMGIAAEIAAHGVKTVILDVQREHTHDSDEVFRKENRFPFTPINDGELLIISAEESRALLKEAGIDGELLHTPGHSADSVSLCLDDGQIFVGDLNPLYELEAHRGTQIGESWELLLSRSPRIVYYGHAKKAVLSENAEEKPVPPADDEDLYGLVVRVTDLVARKYPIEKIARKTRADRALLERIVRMCVTHPNVGADGIFDRIENSRRKQG